MEPETPEIQNGISRRRMIKRIGAGAAIAWTAPVLTSIRTPAFAQGYAACPCFEGCGDTPGCNPSDCFCLHGSSGQEFCSQDFFCGSTDPCSVDGDCPSGWICQSDPSCQGGCGPVCVPPCGTCAATANASRKSGARTNRPR
jgi:hypothetical protein